MNTTDPAGIYPADETDDHHETAPPSDAAIDESPDDYLLWNEK